MGAGVKKAGAGFFALVAVFAISGMSGAGVAGAATAPSRGLKITAASVGTRSLLSATRANPIVINPKVKQQLSMTVRNDGTTPVAIRYLRLTGSLLNVHFVRYQATANVNVAPGANRTISVPGDFFDVDGVATGYMNATMQVVDEQRNVLVSQAFVADVQGKVASSVGLLLLEALVFAVVGISEIVIGLARRRLPWNRFMRAVFFALTGASVVVTVVVAAAMSRDALFGSSTWQPAVLIVAAIGFVLGYLSPGQIDRGARDDDEDTDIDLVAAEAVARASGEFQRTTGSTPSHASGDHSAVAASHASGEHAAPEQHASGGHEPVQ
jgi:hypothetical protein